jgi:hypothetical protein
VPSLAAASGRGRKVRRRPPGGWVLYGLEKPVQGQRLRRAKEPAMLFGCHHRRAGSLVRLRHEFERPVPQPYPLVGWQQVETSLISTRSAWTFGVCKAAT